MAGNPNHARTSEVIDITTCVLKSAGHVECIYLCPHCEVKTGRPDTSGKLYFNIKKHTGFCFRCNTAFFLASDLDETETVLSTTLSSFVESHNERDITLSPVPFEFPRLDHESCQYIKSRYDLLFPISIALGFRKWVGSSHGVAIPFYLNNSIIKFQVRFYTNYTNPYYTSMGPKPLYAVHGRHLRATPLTDSRITLCEGVFDAIALAMMKYPQPMAVLGSSLSHTQLDLLRRLMPEMIYLAMDTSEISMAIGEQLRKLPSVSETKIINSAFSGYKDPEEFLKYELENPALKEQYTHRAMELIRECQ